MAAPRCGPRLVRSADSVARLPCAVYESYKKHVVDATPDNMKKASQQRNMQNARAALANMKETLQKRRKIAYKSDPQKVGGRGSEAS